MSLRAAIRFVAPVALALLAGCRAKPVVPYTDSPDLTPLMNAVAHNDINRAKKLISEGADVNQRDAIGQTALYEAIERHSFDEDKVPDFDNLAMVKLLLKAGANPNETEIFDHSPLAVSLTREFANPSVTLLLLRSGATVPQACDDDDSLLSLATQQSTIEVMKALIDRHAPLDCQEKSRGETALHWAAINGQPERMNLLLKAGANPNLRNRQSLTALEIAPSLAPATAGQTVTARETEPLPKSVRH